MRRLAIAELRSEIQLPATYAAHSVFIGRLLYSYDPDDRKFATRNFAEYRPGDTMPNNAKFVGAYQTADDTFAVFDVTPGEADVPATPDLPDEARAHFVELWRAGFRTRWDKAWLAPDDEPLTTEIMVAVATLQEYGYGAVVSG